MLSGGIVLAEVPRLCCRPGRMRQRANSWCDPCLLRGACVARKPQAAAIRAEAHCRELIGAGFAHSVGRRAVSVPRRGVGVRRERPGVRGCVQIGGVRRQRAPRQRPRAALPFIAARCRFAAVCASRLRAALLASVCLGAFAALTPSSAQTIDGTWLGGGAPVTNEWTQGNNWSSNPDVPDGMATFTNNSAPTSVTISAPTSIGTIQFTSGAPMYSFAVNFALFEINGAGVVNNSPSAPSFTNNGVRGRAAIIRSRPARSRAPAHTRWERTSSPSAAIIFPPQSAGRSRTAAVLAAAAHHW